jgi:hypothetical protein
MGAVGAGSCAGCHAVMMRLALGGREVAGRSTIKRNGASLHGASLLNFRLLIDSITIYKGRFATGREGDPARQPKPAWTPNPDPRMRLIEQYISVDFGCLDPLAPGAFLCAAVVKNSGGCWNFLAGVRVRPVRWCSARMCQGVSLHGRIRPVSSVWSAFRRGGLPVLGRGAKFVRFDGATGLRRRGSPHSGRLDRRVPFADIITLQFKKDGGTVIVWS